MLLHPEVYSSFPLGRFRSLSGCKGSPVSLKYHWVNSVPKSSRDLLSPVCWGP